MTQLTPHGLPVNRLSGRRARIPMPLLLSRRHSALAVTTYALIELLSYDGMTAGADWIAQRLKVSLSSIEKAFTQLSRPLDAHEATLEPAQPAWITTQRRGYRQTAIRRATPGVPYIEIPEYVLGNEDGPLVHHALVRLYGLYRLKSVKGVCHLSKADIAHLGRIKRDRVGALTRDLARVGLVITVNRPGREDAVMPLLTITTSAQRAELTNALATYLGAPVDNYGPPACGQPEPSSSSSGSPSPSSSGWTPLSLYGSQKETRSNKTPFKKTHGTPARDATPSGRARAAWCGSCLGPERRLAYDPDTGHLTGENCPRCGSDSLVAA